MNPTDKPQNPFEPTRVDLQDLRSIVWDNQDAAVLSSQIIVGALGMGVLTFAGYVLFQGGFQLNLQPTLTIFIGVIVAISAIVMSFVIPAVISNLSASRLSALQNPTSEAINKLFAVFQTQLILGCAFLEGAAFLNVFLFQMFHSVHSLAAFAICLGMLLVRIPTKGKIQAWIARRLSQG
jgi:high-affinity Fe2+/Pb2+ permease